MYERERVRADAAEARAQAAEAEAQRWRHGEIAARSKAGSYKFQFEAVREKLTEARAETEAIRDTAKQALSLQAEVARLSKLVDAAGLQSGRRPGMESLRKQVGRLQQENAEMRRRNASLERKNSTLERRNTGLRKRALEAEAAQAKMESRLESLEVKMTALGASRAVLSRRLYGRSSEQQDRPGSQGPRGTLAGWCKAWLERIAAMYRLNKARLAHYEPGAQQQGEAYGCAQRRLQTELDGLFAAAEAERAQLEDTAILYSVVQTLALNGIDVRDWLHEYLGACAANAGRAPPDLARWLPWSMHEGSKRSLMPGR